MMRCVVCRSQFLSQRVGPLFDGGLVWRRDVNLLQSKVYLNGRSQAPDLRELTEGRKVAALGVIEPFRGAARGGSVGFALRDIARVNFRRLQMEPTGEDMVHEQGGERGRIAGGQRLAELCEMPGQRFFQQGILLAQVGHPLMLDRCGQIAGACPIFGVGIKIGADGGQHRPVTGLGPIEKGRKGGISHGAASTLRGRVGDTRRLPASR